MCKVGNYQVRRAAIEETVEASRSKQGGIEKVGAAGGSEHKHSLKKMINNEMSSTGGTSRPTLQLFDAVQLRQQLIDDTIRHTRTVVTASRSQRVEFVEKD